MWYNIAMKDLLKETGKYLYDVSKIILGVAIVTPLVKGGSISFVGLLVAAVAFGTGAYLIHKGGEYDA